MGAINTTSRNWPQLSSQAQSFITALVRPQNREQPLPAEALRHPFIVQSCNDNSRFPGYPGMLTDSERQIWLTLDGFQRLCWLAIARAVSEPELLEACASRAFTFQQYGLAEQHIANGY